MNRKDHLIKIGKPYIEKLVDNYRLSAKVVFQEKEQIMWFEVKEIYGEYLISDRGDAFVVALFMTAMREGADIECQAPVTRRLLYQINHYLIPMLAANMNGFHYIKVYAEPTDAVLECANAVGTGWTAGVDCMFTYLQNFNKKYSSYKLTHLLIANNGAIEGNSFKKTREVLWKMVKKTEEGFAAEEGLKVIGVDTNLQEILQENFVAVVGIRHAVVILALQKLFRIFFDSSSYEFSNFSFNTENIGHYEWLVLNYFETDNTVFYYSGGAFSRGQKLKALSEFPLAQKYLHPCVFALKENCGHCGKCIRTQVALYGLGKLEQFSNVFDVEAFEKDKEWYFEKMLFYERNIDYKEALNLLEQRGIDLTNIRRRMYEKNI